MKNRCSDLIEEQVRAAGGIVLRHNSDRTEVLLVHRPKYNDWSFPKGKAEPGESDEECALREVQEETGLRCHLRDQVGSYSYVDDMGRRKTVHYWAMKPLSGAFVPHEEVDVVRWTSVDEARTQLSYPRDRELLSQSSFLRSSSVNPPS